MVAAQPSVTTTFRTTEAVRDVPPWTGPTPYMAPEQAQPDPEPRVSVRDEAVALARAIGLGAALVGAAVACETCMRLQGATKLASWVLGESAVLLGAIACNLWQRFDGGPEPEWLDHVVSGSGTAGVKK